MNPCKEESMKQFKKASAVEKKNLFEESQERLSESRQELRVMAMKCFRAEFKADLKVIMCQLKLMGSEIQDIARDDLQFIDRDDSGIENEMELSRLARLVKDHKRELNIVTKELENCERKGVNQKKSINALTADYVKLDTKYEKYKKMNLEKQGIIKQLRMEKKNRRTYASDLEDQLHEVKETLESEERLREQAMEENALMCLQLVILTVEKEEAQIAAQRTSQQLREIMEGLEGEIKELKHTNKMQEMKTNEMKSGISKAATAMQDLREIAVDTTVTTRQRNKSRKSRYRVKLPPHV